MQAPHELNHQEVLQSKLEVLKEAHRALDSAITALAERGSDQLAVRRLKKKKLGLKDKISQLEDELTPDIIA